MFTFVPAHILGHFDARGYRPRTSQRIEAYLQYNAMQFNAISIYNARVISWKAESEARAVAMEEDGESRV